MIEYYLRCDLYEGTEINKIQGLDHDIFVQVEITHNKATSQPKQIDDTNSSVKWYETLVSADNQHKCIGPFLLPDEWNENPKPVSLPDVFIYLCVKEFGSDVIEKVSYCRVPLNKIIPGPTGKGTSEFKSGKKMMWKNSPVWYEMKDNLALNKYPHNAFLGALLIALNAAPKSDLHNNGKIVLSPNTDLDVEQKTNTIPNNMNKLNWTSMQLRVHCYQTRNLGAVNSSGLCNFYLEIRFCSQISQTLTCEDCIDPKWYESLYLNVDVPIPLQNAPRIKCELYGYDASLNYQSLGKFCIQPERVIKQNEFDPQWYQLKNTISSSIFADVLCAFELLDKKQIEFESQRILKNPPCKMESKWLHCFILGLRDIQSEFICNKSFLQVEINEKTYQTKTSNIPNPQNPNFCQIFRFEIMLPNNYMLLPNLNLTVTDTTFGGSVQRRLGFVSVKLQDLMTDESKTQFKMTQDEIKRQNIRTIAIQQQKDKDEEKMHYLEIKENVNDEAEIDFISSAHYSVNMEEEPLIQKKHFEFAENDYYGVYEYTKRESYDLSTTLPSYMQDRVVFDDELENHLSLRPFMQIPFFYGESTQRRAGIVKALIHFTDNKKNKNTIPNYKYLKSITQTTHSYLRLYILSASKLNTLEFNTTDTYLVIKIGKKKISTRDDYVGNCSEPQFHKTFEIPIVIPGTETVDIEVWNWNGIGDNLIGRTTINIEDRWYCEDWRELECKPIETRTLWNDKCHAPQGQLLMWMEMITPSIAKKYPLIDISPPTPNEYELRAIIWECQDIPVEGIDCDLYVTGQLITNDEDVFLQQTNIHFGCQNGNVSFNWKMKFPLKLPQVFVESKYSCFKLCIYDKDLFNLDDHISETIIDLKSFLKYSEKYCRNEICKFMVDGQDKFWINLNGKGGKIKISFELLPIKIAKLSPAEFDRNSHPVAVGRDKLSILDKLSFKGKGILCCVIALLVYIFIVIANVIFVFIRDSFTEQ
eukprot:357250_1